MPSTPLPLFVVPIRDASTLCTVEGGRLVEINPIPLPVLADCALNEFGWIAWIEEHRMETICRAHADAEPHEQRFPAIPVPTRHGADSIAFFGQDLVVSEDRKLGVLDFDQAMPPWLPLPWEEESIDGLLADGKDLIVVGKTKETEASRWHGLTLWSYGGVRSRRLELRRKAWAPLWGDFVRAALGPGWIAVLQWTFHMMQETLYLSLFDAITFEWHATLLSVTVHSLLVHGAAGEPVTEAAVWSDVAWLDDVLLLAAGKRGVGILDLRNVKKPVLPGADVRMEDTVFSRQCAERLHYLPAVSSPEADVVRVFPVPSTGQVLAVVKTEAGHDTTLLDVPGCE